MGGGGNYSVCGWREATPLQSTNACLFLHHSLPECQAFPFQRLPQVEAVLWVQGEEMFHSLLIGCKNPTNRHTKDEK